MIDAYGKVRANLLLHEPGFPETAALHTLVKSGQPAYGMAAVGEGKDTEAWRAHETRQRAATTRLRVSKPMVQAGRANRDDMFQSRTQAAGRADGEGRAKRTSNHGRCLRPERGDRIDDQIGEQFGIIVDVGHVGSATAKQVDRDDSIVLREQRKEPAKLIR